MDTASAPLTRLEFARRQLPRDFSDIGLRPPVSVREDPRHEGEFLVQMEDGREFSVAPWVMWGYRPAGTEGDEYPAHWAWMACPVRMRWDVPGPAS